MDNKETEFPSGKEPKKQTLSIVITNLNLELTSEAVFNIYDSSWYGLAVSGICIYRSYTIIYGTAVIVCTAENIRKHISVPEYNGDKRM